MTANEHERVFASNLYWTRAAHLQAMPLDVPDGPDAGQVANVLGFRHRSGKTDVTVTWKVVGQMNLSSHTFNYDSPQQALDAGWELGERFEHDAKFMERMALIYG